jgi:hypothetical protein
MSDLYDFVRGIIDKIEKIYIQSIKYNYNGKRRDELQF